MTGLVDRFGRRITYLRVSVTDKCNLRCVYCMPEEGVRPLDHDSVLRHEEIARIVRIASELGIRRVRITGGEPLVRRGVVDLVRMLAGIPGVRDLSMTTNASMLGAHARALVSAGLRRVNISLDTLRADTYAWITRRGDISAALGGIRAAEAAGLWPIKLNAVVLRGVNSDEVAALARLTLSHAWDVRFIEFMPFWGNGGAFGHSHVVPIADVRRAVLAMGARPDGGDDARRPGGNRRLASDAGPAGYMRLPGAAGRVGFISSEGEGSCAHCNRLRLTADGLLRPCLLSGSSVDLRGPLRAGADDQVIAALIRRAVMLKPARSGGERGPRNAWHGQAPPLSRIGG